MKNEFTIMKMHDEIHSLFSKYGYPWLTRKIVLPELHRWGEGLSNHLGINDKIIRERISSLYWAISHTQISLGLMLFARQLIPNPKGGIGSLYKPDEIKEILGNPLPAMYFMYFDYSMVECIYRCWERITKLIQSCCFPGDKTRNHFNDLIATMKTYEGFKDNHHFPILKNQIKKWDRIANLRNEISHENSAPFKDLIDFIPAISSVFSASGEYIPKLNYSIKNIIEEIEKLKNYYIEIDDVFLITRNFLDNVAQPLAIE